MNINIYSVEELLALATNLCRFYLKQGGTWAHTPDLSGATKVVQVNYSRTIVYQFSRRKTGEVQITCSLRETGKQDVSIIRLEDSPELRDYFEELFEEEQCKRLKSWLEKVPGYTKWE